MEQKGFTLLELLVVMVIIGVLAGVVMMISMQGVARARDARRVQELYQIAHALLQYYVINEEYPGNTDTDIEDLSCWNDWDGGNEANQPDDFIKPLIEKGFLTYVPREWSDVKDRKSDSQCTYRYRKMVNPCGVENCPGTYAILYAACETKYCPVNERPGCCKASSSGDGEQPGDYDAYDIAIFLKEK